MLKLTNIYYPIFLLSIEEGTPKCIIFWHRNVLGRCKHHFVSAAVVLKCAYDPLPYPQEILGSFYRMLHSASRPTFANQ